MSQIPTFPTLVLLLCCSLADQNQAHSQTSIVTPDPLANPATKAVPKDKQAQPPTEVIVISGTRQPSALLKFDGNIHSITSHDIALVDAALASDILNRAPGVHVQANNGVENLPSIRSPILTGPGAVGAFLFLEDGIATRAAGFANNNALAELNLAQAQQIDVIRGPASAIYGSNAVHGVFNVLTQAPQDRTELGFKVGPNQLYQLDMAVGQTSSNSQNEQGIGLNLQNIDNGGYQDNSDFNSTKLALRHEFVQDDLSVSSTLAGYTLAQQTAGFITSGDNGQGCFSSDFSPQRLYEDRTAMQKNCDTDAYRNWWSVRAASHIAYHLSDQHQLTVTPYFRTNRMAFRQHYLPSRAIEENNHHSFGINSHYLWQWLPGVSLLMGLDTDWTQGQLTETQQRADSFSFFKARQQGKHYDYQVDATTLAPFIQANWQYNSALTFSSSLRFDRTQYDYRNRLADGSTKADGSDCVDNNNQAVACLYLRPANRQDIFQNISGKLGVNYLLTSQWSGFANWAQGFRAPQTTDLYRLQNQQSIGSIAPEKITSTELGIRGALSQLSVEAVLFAMDKTHFFFRDDDGLNVTDGETSHRGIELVARYQFIDWLELALNYSYSQQQYEFNRFSSGVIKGNDIDTAPRQQGNAQLTWRPNNEIDVQLEWLQLGKYYLDPANSHQYPGHDLFQLRAQWRLTQELRVTARIENITDKAYASRADFAFGSYRYFGGQPRALYVGLDINF